MKTLYVNENVKRSASEARAKLSGLGLPESDREPLVLSARTFELGGHYGVEMPAINSFQQMEATISALKLEGVYCTRFNETHGSHLLSDSEISDMIGICRENEYGILVGVGPRPEYDINSSFYRTQFGLEMGRQLNNNEIFAQALEEVFRLCELGCRGIIIYDVGLMRVVKELRDAGGLPRRLVLKTSSHCMATNAPIARIFHENGADSITTAHDLSLSMLQSMRTYVPELVLDVPTDVYRTKGGFIRWFDLAELVQVASPVFLKMGASIQSDPYDAVKPEASLDRVRRIAVGQEYLAKYLPGGFSRISTEDRQACFAGKTSAQQKVVGR
ncbi:U32 family peptidase [Roseibium album]|uniref:U32 family peptidase n=1 Tax=Roseibium album TaxID=311410 RepID=UPI00391B0061